MEVISSLAFFAGAGVFVWFVVDWVRVSSGFAVKEAEVRSELDRQGKQHMAELSRLKKTPFMLGIVVLLLLLAEWTDGVPFLSK